MLFISKLFIPSYKKTTSVIYSYFLHNFGFKTKKRFQFFCFSGERKIPEKCEICSIEILKGRSSFSTTVIKYKFYIYDIFFVIFNFFFFKFFFMIFVNFLIFVSLFLFCKKIIIWILSFFYFLFFINFLFYIFFAIFNFF